MRWTVSLLLWMGVARADTLDVSSPDLLVSAELHGMGGAGIASANGAAGLVLHPAAVAHRLAEQQRPAGLGFALRGGQVARVGSPNLGNQWPGDWSAVHLGAGFGALVGRLGVGALADVRREGPNLDDGWVPRWGNGLDTLDVRGSVGWCSWDGAALVGAGPRLLAVSANGAHLETAAIGLELGALLHAREAGLALGVVARTAIRDNRPDTDLPIEAVERPPQVGLGLAWSSGGAHLPWPPLRLAVNLLMEGEVQDGISFDPWLVAGLDGMPASPWVVQKGALPTLSPRGGAEIRALDARLRLRAGAWWEPSRTELTPARLHGTGGVEVQLFRLRLLGGRIDTPVAWRAAVDVADGKDRLRLFSVGAGNSGVVGGEPWERDR